MADDDRRGYAADVFPAVGYTVNAGVIPTA
jgi:hypothetical protein